MTEPTALRDTNYDLLNVSCCVVCRLSCAYYGFIGFNLRLHEDRGRVLL